MKISWYVMTTVFAALGVLAVLRTVERLVSGGGVLPAALIIAVIMLILAVVCFRKAHKVR
jgi:hypothetical protein